MIYDKKDSKSENKERIMNTLLKFLPTVISIFNL